MNHHTDPVEVPSYGIGKITDIKNGTLPVRY